MKVSNIFFVLLMIVSPLLLAADYREVSWDDLMPPGWEPAPLPEHDIFADESFEGQAYDGDLNPIPLTQQEPAPVVKSLDKQRIRIPGYIIPIKFDAESVSEFLLVPYIGACIHVPPPPENQIIYVTLEKPLMTNEFWTPVWVNGVMNAQMEMTKFATAGYHMKQAVTEIYEY